MAYLTNTLSNLTHQSAPFSVTFGNLIMVAMTLLSLYLAIARGFELLFLVPIAFGMFLVNIYPNVMLDPAKSADGNGRLLHYFYQLDEWGTFPPPAFVGVDAMTDFGPLTTNPMSFLLGAVAQFGTHAAYLLAVLLGFNGEAAAAISIIDGADDPTSIFLTSEIGQSEYLGAIAVAAHSYMSLVPIIQPPIMRLLTTEKERRVRMAQLRPVSKPEKILFPIVVTMIVSLLLPITTPLISMLMLGNPFRESSVVRQLTDTASNILVHAIVVLLGTSVGAATNAEAFLKVGIPKIVFLGLVAFVSGTAASVLLGKLICKLIDGKVDPLIGSVDVLVMPMSARVSQKVGAEADPTNSLPMHAIGPNITGVIGTTVVAGAFMAIFDVKQAQHGTIFRVRQV